MAVGGIASLSIQRGEAITILPTDRSEMPSGVDDAAAYCERIDGVIRVGVPIGGVAIGSIQRGNAIAHLLEVKNTSA